MARAARVAVIGAGMAGITCARLLSDHGMSVRILEKSRGIGGRMATRRRDGLQFDHGAQVLHFTGDARTMHDTGASARWPEADTQDTPDAHVGMPGMNDLLRPHAHDLHIRFSAEVTGLQPVTDHWTVRTADTEETFDRVVSTMPAPQLLRIGDALDPALRDALEQVRFAPCYALMVAFETCPGWPTIQHGPAPVFDLLLRDSAKPGRPEDAECWVAHATEDWSRENLDLDRESAADALLRELADRLGPLPAIRSAQAHRWRFSRATRPLGRCFATSTDGRLLAGGDWALGRTAEAAFESGHAMARHVINTAL